MSTPPGPEPDASKRPDPDQTAAESDDDRADTDPLPTMNLWSGGWGGSWADSVPGAGASSTEPAPERSSRAEPPVLGDLELPPPSEPFAFPTTSARPGQAERRRTILLGAAAVAAVAVVGGVIVWLVNRPSTPDTPAAESPTVATTTGTGQQQRPTRDSAAEARLLRALPPGYPPGACEPADPASGAAATVDCDSNIDPGGPTSATFTLARDKPALDALFGGAVAPGTVVICPGNIQSPGPWRRNASPQLVSGTLVCAMQGNTATVAWTDEARLLVSVVRSDPPGPTLDQLYQWWSSHS